MTLAELITPLDDANHKDHNTYEDVDATFTNSDYVNMLDLRQQLGVNHVHACRFANRIKKKRGDGKRSTFFEWYGRGNMVGTANRRRSLNCDGLCALDLRSLKPNGMPWDVRRAEDRAEAGRLQDEEDPDWVIGSPPCTGWCILNWNLNFQKLTADHVANIMGEAQLHLHGMIRIYQRQLDKWKHVLHEHPEQLKAGATPHD